MKTKAIALFLLGFIPAFAQDIPTSKTEQNMDRIERCKKNYTELFGGEALTGQGTDPEMMDILQKFIFGEVFRTGDLDKKTRELITCTTPIELREAIYLCAPFIGFPKTLNALNTINEVFKQQGIASPLERQATVTEEDRHEKGQAIQSRLYGEGIKEAMRNVPGNMGPEVERFLTEFCFGDIYTRNGLDLKTRELLAYCILTTLEAESQLHSHLEGNLLAGNSKETLTAAVIQCLPYIGFPSAIKALKIIKESSQPAPKKNLVRLSKITVDPAQLERYNAFLEEEIEASMRLEPGVLTLYAVSEKEHPNKVTILEIYADQDAYKSHIQTPHFQKYKQGTLQMVQELELVDSTPLIPGLKIK